MDDALMRVLQAAHHLTSSLKLPDTLQKIVFTVPAVIAIADAVVLFLFDDVDALVPQAFVGFGPTIQRIRLSSGESMTGKAYETGDVRIFSGPTETQEAANNMRPHNRTIYEHAAPRDLHELWANMAIPIFTHGTKRGVLVIDNFGSVAKRLFTPDEVFLAQQLANFAAIALQNAESHDALSRTQQDLENALSLQQNQTNALAAANQLYDVLSAYVSSGTLSDVISTLERQVGPPVAVFWPDSRPMIQAPQTQGWDMPRFAPQDVCSSWVTNTMTIYPLLNQQLRLGFVGLPSTLTPELAAIAQLFLSLKLEARHVSETITHMHLHVFVEGLLEGNIEALAAYGDLIPEPPWRLVLANAPLPLLRGLDCVTVPYGGVSVTVAQATAQSDELLSQFPPSAYPIVVGAKAHDLSVLSQSLIEAWHLLSSNCFSILGSTIWVESLNPLYRHLLIEPGRDAMKTQAESFLAPILTNQTLVSTLFTYVAWNRQSRQVSEALYIHPNTLSYRLRKIEDVLQVDLSRSVDWAAVVWAVLFAEPLKAHT